MIDLQKAGPAWKLAAKQKIKPDDVVKLRQEMFKNGSRTSQDIATLLALESTCHKKCPQWDDYFMSIIIDYVLLNAAPIGSLDEEQVNWLSQSLMQDGRATTDNGLEILIRVLECAKKSPTSLCTLVLDQICHDIYATGANRRQKGKIHDTDRMIMKNLDRLINVIDKFSVHEHLRAIGLKRLINIDEEAVHDNETDVIMLYNYG